MPVKKILFVSLTNIGDVILTLPALDLLRERFPEAAITVVAGPRAEGIFAGNPAVAKFIPFDKRAPLPVQAGIFFGLLRERFDLVVDLRNTLFQLLGRPVKKAACGEAHSSRIHLAKAGNPPGAACPPPKSMPAKAQDNLHVDRLLAEHGIHGKGLIIVSPGARSPLKRWPKEKFSELVAFLSREIRLPVVLIGDADDRPLAEYISSEHPAVVDLAGRTTLPQLACLMTRARVVITNDSGNLHLASYLGVPTVAVFGPTDERRYGPWSSSNAVVKSPVGCRPCMKARCSRAHQECMERIEPFEVAQAVLSLIKPSAA
ncbi:MAG: glycosyltransferase family 9 protein [Deltaproteobacteria bacterium]